MIQVNALKDVLCRNVYKKSNELGLSFFGCIPGCCWDKVVLF
jgi:hypothetical protein